MPRHRRVPPPAHTCTRNRTRADMTTSHLTTPALAADLLVARLASGERAWAQAPMSDRRALLLEVLERSRTTPRSGSRSPPTSSRSTQLTARRRGVDQRPVGGARLRPTALAETLSQRWTPEATCSPATGSARAPGDRWRSRSPRTTSSTGCCSTASAPRSGCSRGHREQSRARGRPRPARPGRDAAVSRWCSAPATSSRSRRWTCSTSSTPRTGSCPQAQPDHRPAAAGLRDVFAPFIELGVVEIVTGGAESAAAWPSTRASRPCT